MLHALARLVLVPVAATLIPESGRAGQTWIVDDDPGGGQFTGIQAAIDAAAPGDRILVQPGSYADFTLDKGLTLVGYGQPQLSGSGSFVASIPAGAVAAVVGLSLERLDVDDSQGVVLLQELNIEEQLRVDDSVDVRTRLIQIPGTYLDEGVRASGSRLEMAESAVVGDDWLNGCGLPFSCQVKTGKAGMHAQDSQLHLVRSSFTGGWGDTIHCQGAFAGDGESGLRVSGSRVTLAGKVPHQIQGGRGGNNCFHWPSSCEHSGASAPAVRLGLQSQLWYSGVTFITFDTSSGPNCDPLVVPHIEADPSSVFEALALPDPTLNLTGTPAAGNLVDFRVAGPAGADVLLYLGRRPVLIPDPGVRIELLTPMNVNWPLGTITGGSLVKTYKIRPLQPGFTFYAQAELTYPGGEVRRTNSVPIVIR